MGIKNKLSIAYSLFAARIFRKKTPLVVSWAITTRCNRSCQYCNIHNIKSKELTTPQVFALIDEMSGLGTRIIHFTGGEPLLRDDLGAIIDHCRQVGVLSSVNSNGSLISQRIEEIRNLSLVGLSLDGPEEVHDRIRGQGSYREVIDALSVIKEHKITPRILTVLSSLNLGCVDFLLDKAREFNASIIFQPSTVFLLGGSQRNPLAPEDGEYRKVIRYLIGRKMKDKYTIGHSVSGLKFLYDWPRLKKIPCYAGLVSARIESDGSLDICFRNRLSREAPSGDPAGFKNRFYQLPFVYCDKCSCPSSVELNCMLSFKLDALFNMSKFSSPLLKNAG
jgi:MoaA/NifB/PqqE/SkfB family radical SAM enzyme